MSKNTAWCCAITLLLSHVACGRTDSESVKNDIQYTVKHHEWSVPYIQSYLKLRRDTMSLPYFYSDAPHTFDTTQTAGSQANGIFDQLPTGTYYLYVKGFDPIWGDTVSGGKTIYNPPYDSLLQVIIDVSE